MQSTLQQEVVFELNFWLQILKDHSQFIHDSLAPGQTERINKATGFMKQFDDLLKNVNGETNQIILTEAKAASEAIRLFKLQLIQEHLVGNIIISLPPTFINHMVNEVEEAIRLLSYYEKGERPPNVHPLHHDLLWLLDAAGHAGAVHSNLDQVEKDLKKKSHHFAKEWEAFYLKAVEMAGYLRANILRFPALTKFHNDIYLEMTIFQTFLEELKELRLDKEVLGTLTPLMADHMAREEMYYLTKLAESTTLTTTK